MSLCVFLCDENILQNIFLKKGCETVTRLASIGPQIVSQISWKHRLIQARAFIEFDDWSNVSIGRNQISLIQDSYRIFLIFDVIIQI